MAPKRKNTQKTSSASKKQHSRDEQDIISSLSDTMLLEILSFLDMKHAVQTTVLSKRWRDLWASLCKLEFDAELFCSSTKGRYVGFQNFVDQVLILRDNSDIDMFKLISDNPDCDVKSRLNTWILSVIRSRIRVLYIDVWGDRIRRLPSCLFACNSLTILTLSMGGTRRWSITLPHSMCLPDLVELDLYSVSFHDENLTNQFFLSCPKLERLCLSNVEFLHMNVNISCLKLKHFSVDNNGCCLWPDNKFKLHAPALTYFSCKDYMSKDYILENLSTLVKADFNMKVEEEDQNPGLYSKLPVGRKQMYAQRMIQCLGALHSVEDLKVSPWFLEVVSGSPDLVKGEPTKLCYLTCLRLETWLSVCTIRAIAYLLKISPNIKSLFLEIVQFGSENVGDYLEAEMSSQCLLDKLEIVEIQGAIGCANELNFFEVLLKNAKVLKKLVVCTSTEPSPDRQKRFRKFTEKLLMFPRASSDITILFF